MVPWKRKMRQNNENIMLHSTEWEVQTPLHHICHNVYSNVKQTDTQTGTKHQR